MRINGKKHAVKQLQNNDWLVTLTISNPDFHDWGISMENMGTIYNMDVVVAEKEEHEAVYTDPTDAVIPATEKTEGEKLLAIAHIRCKDARFQEFAAQQLSSGAALLINENNAICCIYQYCNITSRSELTTNVEAQKKFKELIEKFNQWKTQQQYQDNFDRVPT